MESVTRTCCPCGVGDPAANVPQARGLKQTGEVSRVPPVSHKSAEPVKVGRSGTSAQAGPASMPVRGRVIEPMLEAPLQHGIRQTGGGRIGRKAGGAPIPAGMTGIRGTRHHVRQPAAQLAVAAGRNPHGVKSVPKVGEGTSGELGNLAVLSPAGWRETIEATDDRRGRGRSLRSSPRTGKPSTWRRGTVSEASRQEVGR